MGQVNALDGMFDLLGSECRIGVHEVLVNGEGDQIDSIDKSMTFELLQVGDVFRIHLPMQDVNAFHSQIGGSIDDRLYRHLWIAEVPVGVGRNAKLDSVVKGVCVLLWLGFMVWQPSPTVARLERPKPVLMKSLFFMVSWISGS